MFTFLHRIKDKIDNPPEKKDFQKVSHSLARFIKLKNEAALSRKERRQKAKNKEKSGKLTFCEGCLKSLRSLAIFIAK